MIDFRKELSASIVELAGRHKITQKEVLKQAVEAKTWEICKKEKYYHPAFGDKDYLERNI